jgi:hypothetical protein
MKSTPKTAPFTQTELDKHAKTLPISEQPMPDKKKAARK